MSKGFSHRDLEIWQLGMDLVVTVYQLTAEFPQDERFGLISQLRRAAVSIPTNVSEGWGRNSRANLANFVRIARGSLSELDTLIELARRLEILSGDKADTVEEQIKVIGRKSFAFLKNLEGNVVREDRKPYGAEVFALDLQRELSNFED